MSGGNQPTRLRTWNVAAVVLLLAYAAGLVLCCAAALTSSPVPPTSPFGRRPLAAYADPRAWWPLALQLLLGLAALGAYYLPRRHRTRNLPLLVTGGLALSTIVLGVFGSWTCTQQESSFFTPLARALGLLLGDAPTFTGRCADRPYPLALQLGRLLGPLLLLVTALGVAARLFRSQLDRLVVRFARALVVVVGLSTEAFPLIRRVAHDLPRRTVLAVLVPDGDGPLVGQTRQLGARVVACDLDDRGALRVLVRRRGRFAVRGLYLVSADTSANLAWAEHFGAVATGSRGGGDDPPPRITVRIDDPWPAEYWRRGNAYRTPDDGSSRAVRWVSDALSSYEVTAAIVVEALQSRPHDRLVVIGGTPLALALCAELAQRQREARVLGRPAGPSFAELVLVGPTAPELRRQHQIRQERFGNTVPAASIAVEPAMPTEPGLVALLGGATAPAVVFADDPAGTGGDNLSPTLVAAQHPDWTIYAVDPGTQGLVAPPVLERLHPFGLTIEPPAGFPVDSWERAARVVHEAYRNGLGAALDPTRSTHRPWPELSTFHRLSNVRLVTATLAGAESVGRTWGPTGGRPEATTAVTPDELRGMARLEHESWRRFSRQQGWRYGPVRDDRRLRHDALRPWDELPHEFRSRAGGSVRAALATLHDLGYRSWTTDEGRPWQPATRHGEVRASVLDHDWRWQTRSGAWLQAQVGDFRVSNGSGDAWSVEPEIFAATHEHVADDCWRRTGQVWVQPALPGELVISLEGAATAETGDWVMKGAAGEQWLTSAAHFAASYERVGSG